MIIDRLSAILFDGLADKAAKFVKKAASEKISSWKEHGFFDELVLTFPLRTHTLSVTQLPTDKNTIINYLETDAEKFDDGRNDFPVEQGVDKQVQWPIPGDHNNCMNCETEFGIFTRKVRAPLRYAVFIILM